MEDRNKVTKEDMALVSKLIPYTAPEKIPLTFRYGDRVIRGIPADFHPKVHRRLLDSNMVQTIITGENAEGLALRAEYIEYRDFPVTEWTAYITNNSEKNTPILSRIKIMDNELCGKHPVLVYGNGDTTREDGYNSLENRLRKNDVVPEGRYSL